MASEISGSTVPGDRPIPTTSNDTSIPLQVSPHSPSSGSLGQQSADAPNQAEQSSSSSSEQIISGAQESYPSPSAQARGTGPPPTDTDTPGGNPFGRHGQVGVGSGTPPTPRPDPGPMTSGQHNIRPRSGAPSPQTQRSDPFSDSPTRSPPRQSSSSPSPRSQGGPPLVSASVAERRAAHGHQLAGAAGTQPQASNRNINNGLAPRPHLVRERESERGRIIDHFLEDNQFRLDETAGPQFGDVIAEQGRSSAYLNDSRGARPRGRPQEEEDGNNDVDVPTWNESYEENAPTNVPNVVPLVGDIAGAYIFDKILPVGNAPAVPKRLARVADGVRGLSAGRGRTSSHHLSRVHSEIDHVVPVRHVSGNELNMAKQAHPAYAADSISARLSATLNAAQSERDKYAYKARITGLALNIAIGLQVLLGSLTTALSAVATRGKSAAVATTILGALATLVASYLARSRGSNEPELSITRVKDLEQFIRECKNFEKDHGDDTTSKYQPDVERFRERFESLLGNANGERKLSASGGALQRPVGHYYY